jgi:hypothetical protein
LKFNMIIGDKINFGLRWDRTLRSHLDNVVRIFEL